MTTDTDRAMAELVTWIRGSVLCWIHPHTLALTMTPEGPISWKGPICEIPELEIPCEFTAHRTEMLEMAYEVLGTKDMSEFI